MFTVLHLCSAHALKAVAQSFGRQTNDSGLKEFATFCFARLQDCVHMDAANSTFGNMCTVFGTKMESRKVQKSIQFLKDQISEVTVSEASEDFKAPLPEDRDHKIATSIVKRSPFTTHFRSVLQKGTAEVSGIQEEADNPYFCPQILDVLFENYMCIYPLWSGILLGDLARYGSDQTVSNLKQEIEQRDTNCHVEKWFDIVKNNILLKQKSLRPGEFVRKMHTSMQGRYKEHILQLDFPEKLLVKPLKALQKNLEQSQEEWAKKQEKDPKDFKSKYFSVPEDIPEPKALKRKRKNDSKRGIPTVELKKMPNEKKEVMSVKDTEEDTAKV
ncbi:uncharacterized protein LOC118803722 [Colossoma macropomum]|uniref:uncharacterized protein LOC118803722 n=1 Tax=Colossoma macropomum TaxID=42526 RepID=UPI001863CFE0|nr:uncharacterized protein LOC118803722 [Colossoma macropomum]